MRNEIDDLFFDRLRRMWSETVENPATGEPIGKEAADRIFSNEKLTHMKFIDPKAQGRWEAELLVWKG